MSNLRTFPVILTLALLAGCQRPPPPALLSRAERLDQALTKASQFLVTRQETDGAWRSDFYGPFKDGGSLTPLIVHALQAVPQTAELEQAIGKGTAYLAGLVKADGTIEEGPFGLSYPVYTAATAVLVLNQPAQRKARDAWLTFLRQRQLTEDLGWGPADRPYGGWGFCAQLPRKPKPGEGGPPMLEANLSATIFALEALRAAGAPTDDPALARALVFLRRCQNFNDAGDRRDRTFDDGGFFFIYDDPVRNKAGSAGKDSSGKERFHSYGSTTADGLRGRLLCGCQHDDPRVVAARTWLETHFDAASHPGTYAPNRSAERESVYFYYCWSLALAFRELKIEQIAGPAGKVRWAEALADELMQRQKLDGIWTNPALAQRENDPLVATPEAVAALAICRTQMTR